MAITCQGCGQRISGAYLRALGAAWHAACFRCAHCGQSIDDVQFSEKRGRPYHTDCYHQRFSPHCHACKQPLVGTYLRALGKFWHPEHFACAHCGKPISGDYFAHRGKPYCSEDFRQLFREKCAFCGVPLDARFMVDVWGNKFCPQHADTPRCSSCDRYIGLQVPGEGIRYADGRLLCQICRQQAVLEVSEAYDWLRKVQHTLADYDFHFDGQGKIPLRLVGQDELLKNSPRRRGRKPGGQTHTNIETLFGVETNRTVTGVHVLYGLPPEHLGSVLAHELGHVWLFFNRYPPLAPRLEEGICELMTSYWLQNLGGESARMRLRLLEKNVDRTYGVGYRQVRKAVDHTSLPFILDYVRRHASLPR